MQQFITKHYKWFIAAILLFVFVVSILNANNDSLIYDEDAHIPAGYSYVTQHDLRLNPEHPPMLKDFAGLMLLPLHLKFDISKPFWTTAINGQWDAGHDLIWQEGNNADKIIFWTRVPFVLLSLIFALFLFKWGKELGGLGVGLFTLVLCAFDPNILGHNHFVTTDLGISTFMAFAFYYFLRFVKDPSWKNVLLAGFFLGLEQLAKFSSITLFPVLAMAAVIYPLVRLNPDQTQSLWSFRFKKLGEYIGKGLVIFATSLIVVWAVYLANTYKMPEQKLADTINNYFSATSDSFSARTTNKVTLALNKSSLGRPLSAYILGVAMVVQRVDGGNGAYFMGQVSNHGFLTYFPIVFILKEPLPTLFFYLLALIITFIVFIKYLTQPKDARGPDSGLASYFRNNLTTFSLFCFVTLYAVISIRSNLNIGFRHLFPILPFAYLLTAKVIFDFLHRLNSHARFIWGTIIGAMTLLLVAGTVSAYPAYMSYFNELAGGPANGFHYATDSNADWGQDLKRLKTWVGNYDWFCGNDGFGLEQNSQCAKLVSPAFLATLQKTGDARIPISQIRVDYFGGANVNYYFGATALSWSDTTRPIQPGWYAISTNFLMGSIYDKTKPNNQSYRWIKNIPPIAQVGTSIFVYHITPEQATNLNH